jgi:hypothetical protein
VSECVGSGILIRICYTAEPRISEDGYIVMLHYPKFLYCTVTTEKAAKHIVASKSIKCPHRETFSASSSCCMNLSIRRGKVKLLKDSMSMLQTCYCFLYLLELASTILRESDFIMFFIDKTLNTFFTIAVT